MFSFTIQLHVREYAGRSFAQIEAIQMNRDGCVSRIIILIILILVGVLFNVVLTGDPHIQNSFVTVFSNNLYGTPPSS